MDYAMGRCWDSVRELIDAHEAFTFKAPVCLPDWPAVEDLIRDFFAMSRAEEVRFAAVYEKSRAVFAPLGDPLGTDFRRHRQWVSGREEVYSYWLAWVLETIGEPAMIGRLLGSKQFADVQKVEIGGKDGGNEIVISAGGKKLAVIEVKTEKHHLFFEPGLDVAELILLAVGPPEEDLERARFLSWAKVCIELRRIAAARPGGHQMLDSALILAFVGAVEQNILGFAWPVSAHGKVPGMVSHLSKFLQAEEKMEKQQTTVTDEMKNFLQTGLRTYAPGCLALAEFRRQVLSQMQAVLDESSDAFAALGVPVEDLRAVDQRLDDPDIDNHSWVIRLKTNQVKTNQGDGLYSGYAVVCDLAASGDKQLLVEAWIYFGKKKDRDQMFRALEKLPCPEGYLLAQFLDGTPELSCYGNPDSFFEISGIFRGLIQQWLRMLTSAGGIAPYVAEQKELALAAAT